jgi:superfamily I DNA and/or RNA helicase
MMDDKNPGHTTTKYLFGNWQLVAGTAWLFSHENMYQSLDFLFVDEAGQVALANLIAMGTSARNIVLLGDQMQLGQQIQGVHPGRSGESSLDYLLNGIATIPPERGIFLGTTWRMHPDVCQFISEAVYDGRLKPDVSNNI